MSIEGAERGAEPATGGGDDAARLRRQIQGVLVTRAHENAPLSDLALATLAFPCGQYGVPGSGAVLQALLRLDDADADGAPGAVLDARVLDTLRRTTGGGSLPLALDAAALRAEARRLYERRRALRLASLEALAAADALSISGRIELRALRLADAQRRVRAEVLAVLRESRSPDAYADRAGLRRGKKASLREVRLAERAEAQSRREKSRRDRQQYSDHLAAVAGAQRELQGAWRAAAARRMRLVRAVSAHHANVEREDARRKDKNAKERMRALRADDEEAYLRLVDAQKDTRIAHLLRQTDEFLGGLAEKVRAQQAEAGGPPISLSESAGDDGDPTDYFSIAHRVREAVDAQPAMLSGGRLKDYQLRGLQWMVSLYNNNLNGILADEMGLGKTIQTIALIAHLVEAKAQAGPYLVVVPLSTLANWALEFERWAPGLVRVEYRGPPAARRALAPVVKAGRYNVLLTTYEYIIKDKAVLSRPRWLYLIVDEGHRMKNAHSKLVTTLSAHYSTRLRLILTGTPLQNNLPELWALLNFLLPRIFNSCRTFEEWFNAPFANTGEAVELNEEETLLVIRRLHKVLRPFLLRRMKRDVEAELPDKVERVLRVPMSGLQAVLYASVARASAAAFARVPGGPSGGADAAAVGIRRLNNTIMQLRKICNHPFVFDEVEAHVNPRAGNNALLVRAAGKFELLDRMLPKLRAAGHRVLVFFQMTAIMTIMEDMLAMRGIPYLRLDGATKAEERASYLARFNAPDSPYAVFLLSTRAGGLGLNLQSADTVVIFDSDWNPHQDLQAQDRAHRIGQTAEVRIFRLVTTASVEEYILQRAQHKLSLDGKVIQAGKFDQKSTNEERDAMLRAIMEREAPSGAGGASGGGDSEQEDERDDDYCGDDELNALLARSDAELALFREMDAARAAEDASFFGGRPRLLPAEELPASFTRGTFALSENASGGGTAGLSGQASNSQGDGGLGVRRARMRADAARGDASDDDEAWLRAHDMLDESPAGLQDGGAEPAAKRPLTLRLPRARPGDSGAESAEDAPAGAARAAPEEAAEMRRLHALVENCTDGGGRYRSDLFLELPDRAAYPDYYAVIRRPVCLSQISARIDAGAYASLDAFAAEMRALFANAMRYNVEGSQVHADAAAMAALFEDALASSRRALGL